MNVEITPPVPRKSHPFAAAYRVLSNAISAHAFPGCAFGVLARGEVVLQDALGHFTYETGSPAVTPETVYDLASVTKVVATTAAAMLLYQRGLFNPDALLGDVLPEFVSSRSPSDSARRVKLRHLLAHNSGLPAYVEFFRTAASPSELLRACLRLDLEAEPGTRAEYSDPGFILLGKALEAQILEAGLADSLPGWVLSQIFQPLGMTSTCFTPPPETRPKIPPTEVDQTFRKRRIQGEVQDENAWLLEGAAGHAGLFSDVPDLLCFASEILNFRLKKVPDAGGANLFDPATVQVFAEKQGPKANSHALGWDTPSGNSSSGHHFSRHSIGHLGYSGCSLWIDLDAGIAVVLLTNRTWPDRKSHLLRKVRPAFHNAVREALAQCDSSYPLDRSIHLRFLSLLARFTDRIKNWGHTRC